MVTLMDFFVFWGSSIQFFYDVAKVVVSDEQLYRRI
jgi:hypothetical protein